MAANYPIEIDQGTVWRRRIRLRTGTAEVNAPLNLAGHQIRAQVRESWTANPFQEFLVENIDEADGSFDLVLDDRERGLRKERWRWDLLLVPPSGEPQKLMEGQVVVKVTITRLS